MMKIDRRQFVKNISFASLPLLGNLTLPADVLKFTLGFWRAAKIQQLFSKLLLPNVSLATIEREGKVGLFTNGVVVGETLAERAAMATTYLNKRPVLLPVPVANSMAELNIMQKVATKEGHKLGVLSHYHLFQSVVKVQEIIRRGILGEIKQIDLLVNNAEPGMMITVGADGFLGWYFHPLYLTTVFLNNSPSSLQSKNYSGSQPFSNIYFDFESGVKVNLSVKENLSNEHWVMNIRAENGTLKLDGNHKINFKDNDGKTNLFSFDSQDYKFSLEATVLNFIEAVQDELVLEDAEKLAFLSVAWQEAIEQSIASGERVEIEQLQEEQNEDK